MTKLYVAPVHEWPVRLKHTYKKGRAGITGTLVSINNWHLNTSLINSMHFENPEIETNKLYPRLTNKIPVIFSSARCIHAAPTFALFTGRDVKCATTLQPAHVLACTTWNQSAHGHIEAIDLLTQHELTAEKITFLDPLKKQNTWY